MNKALVIWALAGLVLVSLVVPFPDSVLALIGLLVVFYLPGKLLLKKQGLIEDITLSIILSMSIVGLLYLAYFSLYANPIPFFILLTLLLALGYKKFK
ncbi:hypothetical protein ACFL1B_05580 [Nanoarchaeota archaeon]